MALFLVKHTGKGQKQDHIIFKKQSLLFIRVTLNTEYQKLPLLNQI